MWGSLPVLGRRVCARETESCLVGGCVSADAAALAGAPGKAELNNPVEERAGALGVCDNGI